MSTAPLEPKTMSDGELQEACAPHFGETRLENIGCSLPMTVSIIAAAGVVLLTRKVGPLALVMGGVTFWMVLIGLVSLSWHLPGRRRRPFRAELSYRYGTSPPSRYIEEDQIVFKGDSALAYSLLLSAAALPHGGHRWVRVHIWGMPTPRARVEVRVVRWRRGTHNIEDAELVRSEADLPEELRAEILALLDAPGPAALTVLENSVRDGMPCTVTVMARATDGVRMHTGSSNLAGLNKDARNHPTARFAHAMLRAGKVVSVPESFTGWCDATGNIGIGTP
jgi:hypothetical protein